MVHNYSKDFHNFKIKDNILIGLKKESKSCGHIGQLIYEKFNEFSHRVGQFDHETGEEMSFGEMNKYSIRLAVWLKKQHIGKDEIIAISTHNHCKAFLPIVSSLYAGVIFNTWVVDLTMKTARMYIKQIRPKIIFSCEKNVSLLMEAAKHENISIKIVVFGKHPTLDTIDSILSNQLEEDISQFRIFELDDPNRSALILFSSGTTGLPKGVEISYKSLSGNLKIFSSFMFDENLPRKSCSLWYSNVSWISGVWLTLISILHGSGRIFHTKFHPEETCKLIDRYKIDWLFLAPTLFIQLHKSNVLGNVHLESLKRLFTGGAKIPSHVFTQMKHDLPHVFIFQGYGLTESGGTSTIQRERTSNAESIGTVIENSQLKIIDPESHETLGPDQKGEIVIKSPYLMKGYYQNPEATKTTIDEDGWLHTGDIGCFDENGNVFITDRMKDVMKFRGHHVSPSEIESELSKHPDVSLVAVVPIPHPMDIERPFAFVKKILGSQLTEEVLINLSKELGENKKLSGGIKFLDEFPYTTSGKINRGALKEMAKYYAQSQFGELVSNA